MPRLRRRDINRTAPQYSFIYPVLDERGAPIAQLPSTTQEVFSNEDAELRQAAMLALASGCLITNFRRESERCELRLAARIRQGDEDKELAFMVTARGLPACEAEMRRKLRTSGLKPPSKLKVQHLFDNLTL